MKLAFIGQVISEMFYIVDDTRQQQQTPEHVYTISSPCEPDGSGELKREILILRHSRAATSIVSCQVWLKFKLIQAYMHVLITCNNKKRRP